MRWKLGPIYLREYRTQNVLEIIGRLLLCSLSDNTAPGLPTDMLHIWYEHGFSIMVSGYTLRVTKTRLLCPSDGRYGVDVVSHEFTSH
jgi:hypothetical protein